MAEQRESELLAFAKSHIIEAKRSPVYEPIVDIYNHLRFHIDGYRYNPTKVDNPYFSILIEERRPNESENIVKYRKKNYLPKTKQPCFKVLNSLKKIVKSQDWKIDYSKSENPKVVGEETLEQYCEKKYPVFKSVENWLYSLATKQLISDPNGLFYVEPVSWEIENGEKYDPVAKFVSTPDVLAYRHNEIALFKSQHVNTVTDSNGKKRGLPIYILMTPTIFAFVKEINLERDLQIEIKSSTMTEMYAFKSGGVLNKMEMGEAIYDSFIDPMIPSLDSVAGESSDLQAEVVQNIYSTMWYYSGNDCKECVGTGLVNKNGEQTSCSKCEGNGRMLKSPFKDFVIGKDAIGDSGVPTPPGGYLTKPTDMVSLQDLRIKNHIFDALASLNMEFLAQTPLNESGKAKEVDRDELNNFVYGVAYHLVENIANPVYRMINDLRYGVIVADPKEREEMLPSIAVPEKYDLLSANNLLENFQKATESGIDNSIRDEYEVDIINKVFNNQPEVRDRLLLIKTLDPLRGIDDDEKTQLFNSAIITKEDYVLSTYINVFVDELLKTNDKFIEMDTENQLLELRKLAETKIVDEADEIVNSIRVGGSNDSEQIDNENQEEKEDSSGKKIIVYKDNDQNRTLNRVGKPIKSSLKQ